MNHSIYGIIDTHRESLKDIQNKLHEEFSGYIPVEDLEAAVLYKAIKDLDL